MLIRARTVGIWTLVAVLPEVPAGVAAWLPTAYPVEQSVLAPALWRCYDSRDRYCHNDSRSLASHTGELDGLYRPRFRAISSWFRAKRSYIPPGSVEGAGR